MAGIAGQPGTKPSAVQSPVPQTGDPFASGPEAAPAQGGVDPFSAGPGSTDAAAASSSPGVGSQALDVAGRTLDYPGGFMREGAAQVAGGIQQMVTGQVPNDGKGIVTAEDQRNIEKGKGPNSAEYLRRLGVSEGGSFNVPGLGKVTLRGAEGLALDVLTDPLTLIAKTAKEIPYITKLLNAPGAASQALGEAVYKSAVTGKNAEKAAKAGTELIEQGAPVGGEAVLNAKIADAANTMGKIRQGLYDKFTELGGKIDMPEDAFKRAEGVLEGLRKNPTAKFQLLADGLEQQLNSYKSQGFVTMDQISKWKTQLYDSLPDAAKEGGRITNQAKMFTAGLAADFKNLIVENGNKIEKGLGDAIDKVNDKWGALLESQSVKNPKLGGSGTDAIVYALGNLPALFKKKAVEAALGPYGRTMVGNALMKAGADTSGAVRQAAVHATNGNQSE